MTDGLDRAAVIVVAAALIDGNGQVLMQRRPAGKAMAGLWEFPGGKVEPDEGFEAALVRELAEELALDVEPSDLQPLTFAQVPGAARPTVLLLYTCHRWRGAPRALVADELLWSAPADLANLTMPAADVPLVAALIDYLAG